MFYAQSASAVMSRRERRVKKRISVFALPRSRTQTELIQVYYSLAKKLGVTGFVYVSVS